MHTWECHIAYMRGNPSIQKAPVAVMPPATGPIAGKTGDNNGRHLVYDMTELSASQSEKGIAMWGFMALPL